MKRNYRTLAGLFGTAVFLGHGAHRRRVPGAVAAPALASARTSTDSSAAPDLTKALQQQATADVSAAARKICYAAHVQNIGWQLQQCDGGIAGTIGKSLRIEALNVAATGTSPLCGRGYVRTSAGRPGNAAGTPRS